MDPESVYVLFSGLLHSSIHIKHPHLFSVYHNGKRNHCDLARYHRVHTSNLRECSYFEPCAYGFPAWIAAGLLGWLRLPSYSLRQFADGSQSVQAVGVLPSCSYQLHRERSQFDSKDCQIWSQSNHLVRSDGPGFTRDAWLRQVWAFLPGKDGCFVTYRLAACISAYRCPTRPEITPPSKEFKEAKKTKKVNSSPASNNDTTGPLDDSSVSSSHMLGGNSTL
jgi:hypothetical protein